MDTDVLGMLTQFGAAGLIGWMWLSERRSALLRERQVGELHERIVRERREADVLVGVVSDNTRAMAALEASQRALVELIEARRARRARAVWSGRRGGTGADAGADAAD